MKRTDKDQKVIVFKADDFLLKLPKGTLESILNNLSPQMLHRFMITPQFDISEVKILNNSVVIKCQSKKKKK